jgi:hypothetical protein
VDPSPTTFHSGSSASESATACATVLSLPIRRRDDVAARDDEAMHRDADSRAPGPIVTHQGSSPRMDSPTKAQPVSALSAIGSRACRGR